EDGIRDFHLTGVQTCALPISTRTHETEGKHTQPGHMVMEPSLLTVPGPNGTPTRPAFRTTQQHPNGVSHALLPSLPARIVALREIGRASCREGVRLGQSCNST